MQEHRVIEYAEKAYPNSDLARLKKAYAYAEQAHAGQKRQSGEPYFIHPCEVAVILIDLGLDLDTVIAALLHDVIEDTDTTPEKIKEMFGQEIMQLVDGVTKLSRIQSYSKEEEQAESIRKMFLAMAKDIRVILIKLADRLHNMRTLEYKQRENQLKKANETLEIYAPLAHRLGIYAIKAEMEDLSFRYLHPEVFEKLKRTVEENKDERMAQLEKIQRQLSEKVAELHIACEISGRDKHLYSVYFKMTTQNKTFEQIYDLAAVRVIVPTVKDCYAVLGVVHTYWKPLPGRFKDYIAMPKSNMYQSLHTTLMGENGTPFEVQIRTEEMHRVAEYGIAAHWKYKEGGDNSDVKLTWLRQLMEWQQDLRDASEFVDTLKIDFFSDRVFVFTPKGDVRDLVMGSTPLDFAYSIHSEIGNHCIGAKVNKRIVPLSHILESGDIVEILTSPSARGPSRDWLNIVKSQQAKTKIRAWFKRELREENIIKGREMLEREAKRAGYALGKLLKQEWLDEVFKRYTFTDVEDMYAAIGYGAITANNILMKLITNYKKENNEEIKKLVEDIKDISIPEKPVNRRKNVTGVRVKGEENMLVRFARCCNPVPGDGIVGYITRGRGVSVHRSDCNNLQDMGIEPERFIDVSWEEAAEGAYDFQMQLICVDRTGLFVDITKRVSDLGISMTAISAKVAKDNSAVINLTVSVKNKEQLDSLMKSLNNMPDVIQIYRLGT